MYKIYKITSDPTVDFAAEELKKYLRMMMPRCGEIEIEYEPEAKEGFRLGLMQDFGLDVSEAPDVELDDILHIDTDEKGGIIAGDNPRSVLLAVYRYLTVNGCRWLYPGIDGEYIPIKELEPVKYHKMADMRYRGQCNEGCESQQSMIDTIDFQPKLGMNVYMIEFDVPRAYYTRYYDHKYNEKNREPEPITNETVLQWKRQCEVEIAKRGLQFHDMGHGWTAESFGIDSTEGWGKNEKAPAPKESLKYLAEYKGKRELKDGVALMTNFCMSNPEARAKVVKAVCDYSEKSANVDYNHVWLADSFNAQCECAECRKKTVSDWYVILLNEIDDELTRRKLSSRIVFCCYFDTEWPPIEEKLNNPERFSMLLGPAGRSYTQPLSMNPKKYELRPFKLNENILPTTLDEHISYVKEWERRCGMPSIAYEYHYCIEQWYEPGAIEFARLVYDDVRGYHANGIKGIIEDASQRTFFPNGFCFSIYAQTLFDTSLDFDEAVEDYYSHAYGEDWREVLELQKKLSERFNHKFLKGELSADPEKGKFYNPEVAQGLREIEFIVSDFLPFCESHKNMPMRAQTVSMRLLRRYLEYVDSLSKVFVLKSLGADREAHRAFWSYVNEYGKYEIEMERYFDFGMSVMLLNRIVGRRDNLPV